MKTFKPRAGFLVSCLAVALGTGCSLELPTQDNAKEKATEESSAAAAPNGPFLRFADFTSGSQREITADSIGYQLNDKEEFTTNLQADDSKDEPSACDSFLEDIKVSATKDRMTVNVGLDLKACATKDLTKDGKPADGDKIHAATLRMYVDFGCEGADLSIHDGKSLAQLEDSVIDPCADLGGTRSTSLFHSQTHYKATFTFTEKQGSTQTQTIDIDSTESEIGGAADGTGCSRSVADGLFTLEGSCHGAKMERVASEKNVDTVRKLTKTGLTFRKDDVYFRTGRIGIELNGWTGEMTYTGGDVAPQWTVKKGGETKSGTFGAGETAEKASTADTDQEVAKSTTGEPVSSSATDTADKEQSTGTAGPSAGSAGLGLTTHQTTGPASAGRRLTGSLRRLFPEP